MYYGLFRTNYMPKINRSAFNMCILSVIREIIKCFVCKTVNLNKKAQLSANQRQYYACRKQPADSLSAVEKHLCARGGF